MKSTSQLRQQLTPLLVERDAVSPRKLPDNNHHLKQTMDQFTRALWVQSSPQWQADPALLAAAASVAEKPVFICGNPKSGTSLLLELLDNHPQLHVLPGDSHLISRLHTPQTITPTETLENALLFWGRRSISPVGKQPFWLFGKEDQPYQDFVDYFLYWWHTISANDKRKILAPVLAFYCANPKRSDIPRWWVSKTPRNEKFAGEILSYLPNARFLHIVRNPFHNIASMKRLNTLRGRPWSTTRTALSFYNSLQLGHRHKKQLGQERYFFINYEDLATNTPAVMQQVATFLDIPFHKNLLSPTVNGLPAKANSIFKEKQLVGIVNNNISRDWQQQFSRFEQLWLTFLLTPLKIYLDTYKTNV